MIGDWNTEFVSLLNMLVAAVLAGLIGIERELAGKPAGLRTLMLVGASVALLMSLGRMLVQTSDGQAAGIVSDPTRIIHATIIGISFLGAGSIIGNRDAMRVSGLTTAGSILLVAVIGLAAGMELYVLAVGATLLALIVLVGLGWVEHRIERARDKSENEIEP